MYIPLIVRYAPPRKFYFFISLLKRICTLFPPIMFYFYLKSMELRKFSDYRNISLVNIDLRVDNYFTRDDVSLPVDFHGTFLEHEVQWATCLPDTMFNDPENARGELTHKTAAGCGVCLCPRLYFVIRDFSEIVIWDLRWSNTV